jgi:iron complex outermembrane receptor protein
VHWLRSVTEWKVNDALQFKNTLFGYHATRDYRNVETYRYNANNTGVIRSSALLQRHAHNMVGDRLDGTYKGMLGGMKSDWAFGVEASVNRQTRFPNSIAGNVSTVDPYNFSTEAFFSIPGTSAVFSPDRDNKVTTLAGYLENRTSILPAVSLVTGLRHERIDLNLTNRRAVTAAAPASFSRSYAPTTGRIGLVWDVTPGANLYAQYSTAADPPSGILTTASFADVANNSALTTGRQIEVGSKFDFWDKKGNATLSVYRINRQNISTQDPNNTALTILVGEQTAQGVEVSVGFQPTPRWSVQGNLTYVNARFKQLVQGGVSLAGNTPTNTPQSVANLWSSYAFSQDWTGIVGVRTVSKVFADAANTLTAPGYTLLDLGLNYKVSKTVSIVGRVRNATDRIYFANAGTTQVYLGAPRTVDISLRASF